MTMSLGVVKAGTFTAFSTYGNMRTWGNVLGLPAVPDNAVALPGRVGKVFADFAPRERRFSVGLMVIGTSQADCMDKLLSLGTLIWNTTDSILFRRIITTGSGDQTHEAYGKYLSGFEPELVGAHNLANLVMDFELHDAYWYDSGNAAVLL